MHLIKKIIVQLGYCNYPITIATGLFNEFSAFWPLIPGNSAMLVTNDRVAQIYLKKIYDILNRSGIKIDKIILPDGEKYKSLISFEQIITALITQSHGRDTTIIALGGGVIGDLAGFVAASYHRGVRLIQIPTTLLSQIDSAIGGKTAINHTLGKNMIGAFYQPSSVIIDLDCLNTLPQREFSSGLVEVIKYGIIFDVEFFNWLEYNIEALFSLNQKALIHCIKRCCELKTNVIVKDEKDTEQRAFLNLGHTFGHAIEVHMGYGNWLHGEAISAGIMMASYTACRLGYFNNKDVERIKSLLKRANVPISGPVEMAPEEYLPHMMKDKKVISKKLRLVLPVSLGKVKIYDNVTDNIVISSIKDCQS